MMSSQPGRGMPRTLPLVLLIALMLPTAAASRALAGGAPHAATPERPGSRKPIPPADLELKLVEPASPGRPVRFEVQVTAQRPVEDVQLVVEMPAVAPSPGGPTAARPAAVRRSLGARLDAGGRRAVSLSASLPSRGQSEITAHVSFRLPGGGGNLTRGAYLSFEDGRPVQPPAGRARRWNGTRVIEFPAGGVVGR